MLNQSQTLQGFDESVRNELTLLPGIGVVGLGECLGKDHDKARIYIMISCSKFEDKFLFRSGCSGRYVS